MILKSGTDFAVVDCGSGNSWRDAGCDTADQLLTMGCRSVDRVILTHFDDDHINGVEHLLARINVETLTVPEETENGEAPAADAEEPAEGIDPAEAGAVVVD